MASVRKRDPNDPKSPWIVEYTDAGGVRRRKTPMTGLKKDAEAIRQAIKREITDGVHMHASGTITVGRAAELWLRDCDRRAVIGDRMTKQTAYVYAGLVKTHVLPRFGATKLIDLDPLKITEWLNEKRPKYALRTVGHIHKCLSSILDFAVQTRKAKRNIMTDLKVRPPGGIKPRPTIPSLAEARHLLSVLAERAHREKGLPHLNRRAAIPLALFCGLRKTEISALRWENVRFDLGVVQVRHSYNFRDGLKSPKTEAGWRDANIIVLDALLALHAHHRNPATGFVFLSEAGHVIGPQHISSDLWEPLMSRAGFKDEAGKNRFTFHGMRHACVSLLIADGLSPLHIKNFIGHRNVSTTLNIYGHFFPEDTRVKASVDSVAKLFDATKTRHAPLSH